nr:hypothetical protein [uncultured Pseudoxanthomonas sp.]
MRWTIGCLILFLVPGFAAEPQAAVCGSLDACMQQLRALAKQGRGFSSSMTNAQSDLLKEVRRHPGAVDALVPLLEDPDENLANIAAAGLRDVRVIDPKYFPQIVRGLDRGLGWLAPALGRIGTAEAADEAVARLLVSESAPANQEAYAVKLSGRLAVPAIVAHAACRRSCGEDTYWILGAVLADMGTEARRDAAPGLLDIVVAAPDPLARKVLGMIRGLGEAGATLESRLAALAEQRPTLQPNVDMALVGIRSSRTGAIFAKRLQDEPHVLTLRDLAEAGSVGATAGEVVTGLLDHGDAEIRVAAARALGFIGYAPAAAALTGKLDDAIDVRLSWTAAESLGRLHAASAIPALERIAASHWHMPVRVAAGTALRHIREGTAYPLRFHEKNFPLEFFAYQHITREREVCLKYAEREQRESREQKLYARTAQAALSRLAYATTVVSFGPAEPPDSTDDDGDNRIVRLTPDNMVEHRRTVSQTPSVALRIDDGWLAGGNRGEWGGELVFIGDDGVRQTVLDRNVWDIFAFGNRYVATVGLAHLSSSAGEVVELSRQSDGSWRAETWRVLPGAPSMSYLTRQGELLVATNGGTGFVISPDGRMREAVCTRTYDTSRVDRATRQAQEAADAAAMAADEAAREGGSL